MNTKALALFTFLLLQLLACTDVKVVKRDCSNLYVTDSAFHFVPFRENCILIPNGFIDYGEDLYFNCRPVQIDSSRNIPNYSVIPVDPEDSKRIIDAKYYIKNLLMESYDRVEIVKEGVENRGNIKVNGLKFVSENEFGKFSGAVYLIENNGDKVICVGTGPTADQAEFYDLIDRIDYMVGAYISANFNLKQDSTITNY